MTGHVHGDVPGRQEPLWDALDNQVLIHTKPTGMPSRDGELADGLILCSAAALGAAKDAQLLPVSRLLFDLSYYEQHTASAHETFRKAPPGDASLLYPEPDSAPAGEEQIGAGATAVLTPTLCFRDGDRAAIRTAVSRVQEYDPASAVLVVPLDARWLQQDDDVRFLIRSLNGIPHIKALAFGAIDGVLPDENSALRLRGLITGIERVALIRTDLAGLDALAYGALFVSIGVQASCRAFRPPYTPGRPDANLGGGAKARVLHPVLMEYFYGAQLAHLYGWNNAPECHCGICNGQHLARFSDSPDDVTAANWHNVATWLRWAEALQAARPGPERRLWKDQCWEAIKAREAISRQWRSAQSPTWPAALKAWATAKD
ncbi:hypothetical protein ACFYWU_42265 [Streptomyces chrestomyceticus]|uniref:hypothetical protein n=1 Tax=Streptomyces chrestomyceticus TaxID=68185 RepID=UPI003675C174